LHGTGTRAAQVSTTAASAAAFAARACRLAEITFAFHRSHGKRGKLLFQPSAVAFRAMGFLGAGDDGLEPLVTLFADVFVDRHGIRYAQNNHNGCRRPLT